MWDEKCNREKKDFIKFRNHYHCAEKTLLTYHEVWNIKNISISQYQLPTLLVNDNNIVLPITAERFKEFDSSCVGKRRLFLLNKRLEETSKSKISDKSYSLGLINKVRILNDSLDHLLSFFLYNKMYKNCKDCKRM